MMLLFNSCDRSFEARPARAEVAIEKWHNNLDPILISKIETLLIKAKAVNIDCKVYSAYRSKTEQLKLYAQGRTAPGKIVTYVKHSKHNDGRAVDICVIKNGKADWRPESYFRLGEIAEELGLAWGGSWKMRDYGHFEI